MRRAKAGKKDDKESKEREDGRKATSTYLDPKVIKSLQLAAVSEERPAYEIIEEAVIAYLKKTRQM